MSKVTPGHPGEEMLLRYADGELSPRESADVRTHLEACWDCRAELDGLQAAVSDCVHYRKAVLQKHLAPPPAPWRDLSAGMAAIDRELAVEAGALPWWRALLDAVSAPRFWAPALAAALAAVFLVTPWLRETPTVQAAELLRKAVVASEAVASSGRSAMTPAKRRLAIRVRPRNGAGSLQPVALESAPAEVGKLFAAARYNWADPLSAKSYLAWHEQLPAKTDEVIDEEAGQFYRVRTVAASGELAEASLRLRRADLMPVEGTFRFRNGEWVEIREMETVSVAATAVNPSAPKPAAAPDKTAALQPAAAPEASVADELQVLAALHKIGADLGDPIEVARQGADVRVRAFGLDARRQAQVARALNGLSTVRLEFTAEGAPPSATASAGFAPVAVRAGASPLQARLEAQLGSPAAVEQLANDVFDRNENVMERAHAIRRLSARFPSPAALMAGDRVVFQTLVADHARQLVRHSALLRGVLKPVLPPVDVAAVPVAEPTAENLFRSARALELTLASWLGGQGGAASAAEALPERAASQLTELEQIARAYLESMGQ